jgi:hypothetical protein
MLLDVGIPDAARLLIVRIAGLDGLSGEGRSKTVDGFLGDRPASSNTRGGSTILARAPGDVICRLAGTFDRKAASIGGLT